MNTPLKTEQLPDYFRPILWSYRFDDIDPRSNAELIICQAINYGTLDHLQWIKQFYGEEVIRNVLLQVPMTALRAPARKLAGIIFNIIEFNDTSRGTNVRS